MATKDGLDWFTSGVIPGWAQTQTDIKQLEHSVDKGCNAWTCAKMQEQGVCVVGTKCFEKKPPYEVVEGHLVAMADLHPDTWPEPSPIRYAFGKGDDFLLKLKADAAKLADEKDETKRQDSVAKIIKRAQAFDAKQQDELKAYLKTLKLVKAPELTKAFAEAKTEARKEHKERIEQRNDFMTVGENEFKLVAPHGYFLCKESKQGGRTEKQFCGVNIWVEEIRHFVDEGKLLSATMAGVVQHAAKSWPFQIPTADWHDNRKFIHYFSDLTHAKFNILPKDADLVRQAAMAFSDRRGKKIVTLRSRIGFDGQEYLSGDVKITAENVEKLSSEQVFLNAGENNELALKYVPEAEARDVAVRIVKEVFTLWPLQYILLGLGVSFGAIFNRKRGINNYVLALIGITGSGKTELGIAVQNVHGPFTKLKSLLSSTTSIRQTLSTHADCLILYDDFRSEDPRKSAQFVAVVQNAYDGGAEEKCSKLGEISGTRIPRASLGFTGEHFPTGNPATRARAIVVEPAHADQATPAQFSVFKKTLRPIIHQ